MIIDKDKLIFIHIPKNAGTSIKELFFNKTELETPFKHKTIHEIKEENHKAYSSYRKFAIVRNPYDRMISWYAYLNGYILNNDLLNTYQWNGGNNSYEVVETERPNVSGFKKFVKDPAGEGWGEDWRLRLLNKQCYWIDETVTILKYENLEKELNEFFGEKMDLQTTNKTVRDSISVYYDKESLDTVYDRYKEDFKKFNYKKL